MEKLNLEISLQNKVDRYVQFSMKNKELTSRVSEEIEFYRIRILLGHDFELCYR